MKKMFLFILSLSFLIYSCKKSGDITGSSSPSWFLTAEEQKKPYSQEYIVAKMGDDQFYRIPGIISTDKNTIIAVYDNRYSNNSADIGFVNAGPIDPTVRRSVDGGKTWGSEIIVGGKSTNTNNSHGEPLIFKAKNGDLVILASAGGAWATAPTIPSRVAVSISKDDGMTWSPWKDVINGDTFKNNETLKNGKIEKGFMAAGRGLTLKDGRLIGGMLGGSANGTDVKSGIAVYSDDNGNTWHIGGIAKYPNNNEGNQPKMIAELNDGSILMSIGPSSPGKNRVWSYSKDRGITWTDGKTTINLIDGRANAEGVRYTSVLDGYDKNRLLFVNCNSPSRTNLTVSISTDEGSTWIPTKILEPRDASYSSIDILGDGTIITFSEEYGKIISGGDQSTDGTIRPNEYAYNLVFRRFNLYSLTDGREYYKKRYSF